MCLATARRQIHMLRNRKTSYPRLSICDQMKVLFLEQANGAAKRASYVPCRKENCIVLFFGDTYVQESSGTLLGVQQVNILGQSEYYVQRLFLRRRCLWFQSDTQRIVGLIELRSSFPQTNLLGISVGPFCKTVDNGIGAGSPWQRSSTISSHHKMRTQPLDPLSVLLFIWKEVTLMDSDVLVIRCLLCFL